MGTLRAIFREHYRLAALLVVLALVMKAAIPAGYMLGAQDKVLTVLICADASGEHQTRQITIPVSGKSDGQSKSGEACPYASLSGSLLDTGELPFIALALAFILLLGFAPVRIPGPAGQTYLRPPLRGPPALI
jgi:Protein of unknown function (DUF2946)